MSLCKSKVCTLCTEDQVLIIFIFSSGFDDKIDSLLRENCVSSLFTKEKSCYTAEVEKTREKKSVTRSIKRIIRNVTRGGQTGHRNYDRKWNAENAGKNGQSHRLSGTGVGLDFLDTNIGRLKNTLDQYPWLCSLKTR